MLAIVIISFRRAAMTARCISSLRATTTLPYRVFLVDNGSADPSTTDLLSRLERSADLTLLRLPRNLGPSAGRNAVLQHLPRDYNVVALFDNDIVALPGWDRAAVRALECGADLIQPKLLKSDGITLERGPNRPNPSPFAINPEFIGCGLLADDPSVSAEEDASIVGTPVLHRVVIDRIGFFDERLQVGEDYDFSFRAREAGFVLRYAPECVLIHDHGFDIEYEQERALVDKYLLAHVVLWRRWRKALLSPAYLHWYNWLHLRREPMYLPSDRHWSIAHRRLWRRLVRYWLMHRHANDWNSAVALDRETERLAAQLETVR